MANVLAVIIISVLQCQKVLSQPAQTQLQQHIPNCHYWSHYNEETNTCDCGSELFDIVQCKTTEGANTEVNVSLISGYCMTLNNNETEAVVGACPYRHYMQVSRHLTRNVCGQYNRTGQLCGECINGSSPPVYSYYTECFKCSPGTNNWLKYFAISLLPTTAFLLVIILFRFRASSPQVNGYIFMCQVMTLPILLRFIIHSPQFNNKHYYTNPVGDLYFSILGIWNLDFFRMFYAPFCLHPNASTLQVLSLDYIIAVYPLALIIITYTLARLHYNNCRLVVWLWRPFIGCFARCRRQWDIQNSLVDAFATFLLLSYVKFFSVSFDLLTPTIVWDSKASINQITLYYSGNIDYFGTAHLPYAVMAILVLLVFIFLPTLLLCLYPCLCFQRLLNRCHCNGQVLHYFMDSFQGSFKDGTNGTKDCRYFAAIYLIARIVIHFGFIVTNNMLSTSIQTSVLLLVSLLVSCFQPYKKPIYTKMDICFLIILCIMINSVWEFNGKTYRALSSYVDRVYLILLPVPIIYPLCLVLYYILRKSSSSRIFWKSQLKMCCSKCSKRATKSDDTSALLKGF